MSAGDAQARHAPDVPVVDVVSTDTDLMDCVAKAAALADVVRRGREAGR